MEDIYSKRIWKLIKNILIKAVYFTGICLLYCSICDSIDAAIANSLAMQQMDTDTLSNIWFQIWVNIKQYSFIPGIIIAVLLFKKDCIRMIKLLKTSKGEK